MKYILNMIIIIILLNVSPLFAKKPSGSKYLIQIDRIIEVSIGAGDAYKDSSAYNFNSNISLFAKLSIYFNNEETETDSLPSEDYNGILSVISAGVNVIF